MGRTHTVRDGDTLYRIGLQYTTTPEALREINALDSNTITVGQVLIIDEPVTNNYNEFYLNKKNILVGRAEWNDIPQEHRDNGIITIDRINRLLAYYYKDVEQGKATYQIALNDGYRPPSVTYGSKNSKHRINGAVDLDDNIEGDLWFWILDHLQLAKEIGLWFENPNYTHYFKNDNSQSEYSWIHIQTSAPGSGNRVYIPSTKKNPNPGFWNDQYDRSLDGYI